MEVRDYCSNVDMELTLWKAKIFDAIRRADQLGSAASLNWKTGFINSGRNVPWSGSR
jgi:hypothetical protein